MTTASKRERFRAWRRRRPFWGGLLLMLAGLELFFSANQTIGDMQVHIGPTGFLSYLLPAMLLLCGLLVWFTPGQRLFYGILGLLTALYSLIGLNLGGFFVGMILGILGGALTLAWAPRRPVPAVTDGTTPDQPGEPAYGDTATTQPVGGEISTSILPGFAEPDGEQAPPEQAPPSPRGSHRNKMFVIALVPTAMTAAMVVAGSHLPARADECPDGLPSRTTAAASSAPAKVGAASVPSSRSAAGKSAPRATAASTAAKANAATGKTGAAAKENATPPSSAPASADDEESDHPVLDGIKDAAGTVVSAAGKLLGLGDEAPAADPSPSASEPSAPVPAPTTTAPAPADPPATSKPATSKPAAEPPAADPKDTAAPGTKAPTAAPAPSSIAPVPSSSDIPCLGPRVFKEAGPDDLPGTISLNGATLEGESLTMYNSSYDGVTTLTTPGGPLKALKFSMTKSVTKPFKLTVGEDGGHTTQIDSSALTTEGNVRFYTPKFTGKLFGLIPVTFTPDSPPPLTLPVLWFTDVKIHLAFVRCDSLTADPIKLTEKP
ncbi:DUF6114 domain-containing protein [Krasilnikovia sp. MM14-A1259]|uniref:DUF6114 domain-containing protein n=1 Tax=Krasilnikovia sp. MM14-A1259 TaxID=3373539 RepID=UPI0037F4C49F